MIEASKVSGVIQSKLVIPINLSLRVSGAFYAVYGAVGLWKLLQSPTGTNSAINIIACAVLGAFCLFGLVLSLSVNSFTLDFQRRRYSYRKGLGPFAAAMTGDASEIRAVSISRHAKPQGDPEFAHTESFELRLNIEWVGDQAPLLISRAPEESLFGGNTSRSLTRAIKLARDIGVPVENRMSQS